jgi:nucleoside-diphosphate-sugar epimerase
MTTNEQSVSKRVLVTGAGGRLGQHVVRDLAAAGWSVTGLIAVGGDPSAIDDYADHVLAGRADDVETARLATAGVDAVVHLAAIPAPMLAAPEIVFGRNTLATFCILDAAAATGASCAVIASSFSATGLPFSPKGARPQYVPLDEDAPSQAADAYALSKTTDEATADMISRRDGMTTTALRFPFLGTPDDRLLEHAEKLRLNPGKGVGELWSYLDTRDAADSIAVALRRTGGDSAVINVAAPQTLSPYPTAQLLDAFMPHVPRRRALAGHDVPIDLSRATQLLGFTARHLWQQETADLPAFLETSQEI